MENKLEALAKRLNDKGEYILAARAARIVLAIKIPQIKKLHDEGPFAIISAYRWDPGMSISKNKQRNHEFMLALQQLGLPVSQATGYWGRKEKSFIIKRISFEKAKEFAEKYQQEAFIFKDPNGPVVLYNLHTASANPVETIEIKPASEFGEKAPTEITNVGIKYKFDWNQTFPIGAKPIPWSNIKIPVSSKK